MHKHEKALLTSKISEIESELASLKKNDGHAWLQKSIDYQSVIIKQKSEINQNLTNHKEATDMLRAQLKEARLQTETKEEENRVLKSKIAQIKMQVSKLEKLQ